MKSAEVRIPEISSLRGVSSTPAGEVRISGIKFLTNDSSDGGKSEKKKSEGTKERDLFLTRAKAIALADAIYDAVIDGIDAEEAVASKDIDQIAALVRPAEARKAIISAVSYYGARSEWTSDSNEVIPMILDNACPVGIPSWDTDDSETDYWSGVEEGI